ncbi:hypothetical protein CLF_103560 [Clonorchis sinensis]|uniref:Uncharacterized protein n=1 Tax=Clonorchis sinensis TaxID=79923 RepID=G7YNJ6_CLOSI|nr:hypothetical protein CLF_103560 [Clonorchis sinensis]
MSTKACKIEPTLLVLSVLGEMGDCFDLVQLGPKRHRKLLIDTPQNRVHSLTQLPPLVVLEIAKMKNVELLGRYCGRLAFFRGNFVETFTGACQNYWYRCTFHTYAAQLILIIVKTNLISSSLGAIGQLMKTVRPVCRRVSNMPSSDYSRFVAVRSMYVQHGITSALQERARWSADKTVRLRAHVVCSVESSMMGLSDNCVWFDDMYTRLTVGVFRTYTGYLGIPVRLVLQRINTRVTRSLHTVELFNCPQR